MPVDTNPTVRRRRLGSLLRGLRESAGLTLEDAAQHLECHKATISRLELGRSGVRARDLRQLLALYGVTEESRVRAFLEMAKRGRESGWWQRHADGLRPSYVDFIELEAESTEIRSYQPLLVPGLLQTVSYSRSIVAAHPAVTTEAELARHVEVRTNRQAVLTDGRGVHLWAIIGEAALRSLAGGRDTMREQLGHLLDAAQLPNVDLQVLPIEVGEHPGGNGPFVIFTFPLPEDSHIVCEEGLLTSVYLDSLEEAKAYAAAFDALRAEALGPRKTRDFIEKILADL